MSRMLKDAAAIASEVHRDQKRIHNGEPYINHCKRVAGMLARDFPELASDEVLAAAILHDSLEDCPSQAYDQVYALIDRDCGPVVAAFVEILTKPKDIHRQYSMLRYFNRIAIAPTAVQTIKCLDRIDNLLSIAETGRTVATMQIYLQDSEKIKDILQASGLIKQAELLNVHIVAATSKVATLSLQNRG